MKFRTYIVVIGIILSIQPRPIKAQQNAENGLQAKIMTSYHLKITRMKTTNIVFPSAIVGVDRGSRDVLVQKARGAENILQLKAAKDGFLQTSLTVIVADGKFFSFIVDYANEPSVLNLAVDYQIAQSNTITSSKNIHQRQLEMEAQNILLSPIKVDAGNGKIYGIHLQLNGIFIHDEVMFFRLNIMNSSNISYDIEQLRFYIRDQKKAKRTASQEIELTPLFVYNKMDKIAGISAHTMVFAVPKFTIPDKKYLVIQLMEKNGGRHLELPVKNRIIMKSIALKNISSPSL